METCLPIQHAAPSEPTAGTPFAWPLPFQKSKRVERQRVNSVPNETADQVAMTAPETSVEALNAMLLAVAVGQDRAAFRGLFDHFAPRLKAFVRRQGTDPQMAEEVVQETMVKVWHKAGQFDPAKASAATWVFTIARNMRIDHLRKANRPEPDYNDPAFVPDAEPGAVDRISRDQEAGRLHAALTVLPEEQQAVLRLAFFEDKAHAEIAEELGIPLGTVKSRIRLAFKRVRSEIGEIR